MRADLALVGFGHVGRRFARLLNERRDWLALDYDLDCRVVGIATRRHGETAHYLYADGHVEAIDEQQIVSWAKEPFNFALPQ